MTEILYRDSDIAVVIKPVGLSSERGGLVDILESELGCEVYPLHRLDTGVGGVMLYALNRRAAAVLSADIQAGLLVKEYFAVVYGKPENDSGAYEDLLFHDRLKNKSYTVKKQRSGVKKALLDYRVTAQADGLSLVEIRLHTGRTHQIRVQFSSRRTPLYGDGKYGGRAEKSGIALFSRRISFAHPKTKEALSFEAKPTGAPWDKFTL